MADRRVGPPPTALTPPDPRDRWRRVSALLDAALEMPPDERTTFVRSIEEPALRDEVARLLAACGRAEGGDGLATGGAAAALTPHGSTRTSSDTGDSLLQRVRAAVAGRYGIERELGRGGMAVVFLARDLRHDRPVALKVMRPELAAGMSTSRFLQEIEFAARLSHPHIVPLFDSGEADGLLYYAMPFIEGESLRQRLMRERQLSVRDALQVTREIADALDYAHRRDVVHRDVKPENVLLVEGHALLADFGIARAIHAATGDRLTGSGLMVGTPGYMSPEALVGDSAGPEADVYALARVAFELLVGALPSRAAAGTGADGAAADGSGPRIRRVRPDVSRALEVAIQRGLAPDPSARFKSARAFAEALEGAAAGETWRHTWRRWAGIGALGVAASASIAILLRPPPPQAPAQRKLTAHGRVGQVVMTRDGNWLAYTVERDSTRIIVSEVNGKNEDTVYTGECCLTLEWSSDGKHLLSSGGGGGTFVISRQGEPVRPIRVARTQPAGVFAYWVPRTGETPGRRISLHTSDVLGNRILLVDIETEDTTRLDMRDTSIVMMSEASWSPDGRLLALRASYQNPPARAIVTVDSNGVVRRLVDDSVTLSSPRWSRDGRTVYYVRGTFGDASIHRVDVSSAGERRGEPRIVHAALEALPVGDRFTRFSITDDGSRAVYTRGARFANLWLVQLGADPSAPRLSPLTHGTADLWSPAGSPDGRRIAFAQRVGGGAELFVMPLGGSARQYTTGARVAVTSTLAWSPAGDQIAFTSERAGSSMVMIANLADGSVRSYPRAIVSGNSGHLSWAPSTSVVFPTLRRDDLQLLDAATGRVDTVLGSPPSTSYTFRPRFAPDGHRIAFRWGMRGGQGGLFTHDLRTRSSTRVARGGGPPLGWTPDGRRIYAARNSEILVFDAREAAEGRVVAGLPFPSGDCSLVRSEPAVEFVCVALDFTSDVYAIEPFEQRRRSFDFARIATWLP
jgi:Tol biopolymer transport system component